MILKTIDEYIKNQPSIPFEEYYRQYIMKMQDRLINQEITLQFRNIEIDIVQLNKMIDKWLWR